jgi:hypothetical protein
VPAAVTAVTAVLGRVLPRCPQREIALDALEGAVRHLGGEDVADLLGREAALHYDHPGLATARWCFARLALPASAAEPGWLHRRRDEWAGSGQPWDGSCRAWAT